MPKTMLMCPPDFFDIEYAINPWMNIQVRVDHEKAKKEWELLVTTFEELGVAVERMQAIKGLPDLVFTANGGIVQGKTFVRANFRYRERQGEQQYFESWFRDHGYEVKTLPQEIKFEGTGDVYPYQGKLLCGYGFRSDRESHNLLGKIFAVETVSFHLIDPKFYHMDTCLTAIDDRVIMYYPEAFDDESKKSIQKLGDIIAVTSEEARHFVCNSVFIDETLVVGWMNERLEKELGKRGITTQVVNLEEFLKSGGNSFCLKLWI